MAKVGRPSTYTQELTDIICAELAEGKSLRTILKAKDMPVMSTVFLWLRTNTSFSEQYARAKEEGADAMVDEMLSLADEAVQDSAAVNKARLQVDTRKWIASKLKPKKYGDKTDITTDGQPLSFNISRGNPTS